MHRVQDDLHEQIQQRHVVLFMFFYSKKLCSSADLLSGLNVFWGLEMNVASIIHMINVCL